MEEAAYSAAIENSNSKASIRRKIHFLPFAKNSKRDEIFTALDSQHKIAPAFTHSEKCEDPVKAVNTLREYLKQFQLLNSDKGSTMPPQVKPT